MLATHHSISAPAARLPAPQQVGMGQLCVAAHGEQLQALLGSCIGIGFIWRKGGCCGLAHCLLPEAPGMDGELGARYVSQAVPSLLRLMGARVADYPDIEVVLAGGASMFGKRSARLQIGQKNVEAAQKHLTRCGLAVSFCALGGERGRQLLIDGAHHSFAVTEVATAPPAPLRHKEGWHGHA